MSLKLFIVEHYKTAEYEYYVAKEDEMWKLLCDKLDKTTKQVLIKLLNEHYGHPSLAEDNITYDLIEDADFGFVEDVGYGFYCKTPITNKE